ncbi:MAG: DUF5719 family protein [Microthrixaceae bacterium]
MSDQQGTGATKAPRSAALRGLFVGARIVSGLVAVGVMVAAVGGAALLPLPTVGGSVRSDLVEPEPVAETRVCAGPVLRLGADDGTDATRANSIGSPEQRFAATEGTPQQGSLTSTDSTNGAPPHRIDLEPHPENPALLAASQSQRVTTGGLTGFAAAECSRPSSDSWLVAGSTVTGRTALITLANPSTVESTVTIELYTEAGRVTTTGLEGIVVPVGGQRILSIAGWVPDAESIVVRVRSAGGAVVAHLQHSVTRVLTPGGVDIAGAGASPSNTLVIPGFVVDAHAAIEGIGLGGDNYDLASIVRLLAPGDADASVTMTVRPTPGTAEPVIEDGEELTPQTLVVPIELTAGEVTDIPFDHLLDGSYTVVIDSTVPVVAAARSSIVGEPETDTASGAIDFAWFPSVPPLADSALVSVAPGPGSVLHLVNTTPNPVRADIHAGTGASTVADVPAGGAVAVPVTAGGNYTITGFDTLYLSVSYTGDGALAGFGVTGPLPIASAVTVYY